MIPQITSRASLVIDGILALVAEDPGNTGDLDGVQIIDGPETAEDLLDDVIQVAPGDPERPGAITERIPQPSLGRHSYIERTEVTMIVSCYSGDTNMKARRDRATALFNAVKRRVDANRVRAGAWENLYLGPQEAWHPVQASNGATVAVGFTLIAESVG